MARRVRSSFCAVLNIYFTSGVFCPRCLFDKKFLIKTRVLVSLLRKEFVQKQFATGGFRMFLSCHVCRTVFFGCVFATVFCVFCAWALPNDVNPDDNGTTYAATSGIAGVSYVKDVVANKENTMNKVTSLIPSVTDVQYPSALAVYSAVSERVSTSSAANQSMAGKYNVTGTLSVPDLPLPRAE